MYRRLLEHSHVSGLSQLFLCGTTGMTLMLLHQSAQGTSWNHEIIVMPDLTGVNDSPKLPCLLLNCFFNRITINSFSSPIIFIAVTHCTYLSAK